MADNSGKAIIDNSETEYIYERYRVINGSNSENIIEDTSAYTNIDLSPNTPNKTLEIYQNQYLNSLEEFAGDANIENVGEVFWRKLVKVFDKNGWKLIRLEIGENPLRVYAVSVKEIRL